MQPLVITAYCQETSVDVALIQEPYTNRGRLIGFEAEPLRSFLSLGMPRPGQANNIVHGAAIVVFNPALRIFHRDNLSSENFAVVDLDNGEHNVTLLSGYFKYRVPTVIYVTALMDILDQIGDDHIVALDGNALSTRWFSRITDQRGDIIVDMIPTETWHV